MEEKVFWYRKLATSCFEKTTKEFELWPLASIRAHSVWRCVCVFTPTHAHTHKHIEWQSDLFFDSHVHWFRVESLVVSFPKLSVFSLDHVHECQGQRSIKMIFTSENYAFVFFVSLILVTFFFELFYVLEHVDDVGGGHPPHTHPHPPATPTNTIIYPSFLSSPSSYSLLFRKCIHYTSAIFILHQVLGSLTKLFTVDSSIRGVVLPSTTTSLSPPSPPSAASSRRPTQYCMVCECYTPPRAFHCRDCGICILKRTHHCLFAKRCVGYKNFRFFLCLLLYVCIGCLYSSILNQSIVWPLLGGFNCRNFLGNFRFFN